MTAKARYVLSGFAAAWMTVCCIGVASAEILVLESNAPGIEKNMRLQDDDVFVLPKGTKVRLLMKPSEKTRTMSGPFTGTVEEYQAKYSGWLGRLRHTWDSIRDKKPGHGELGTRQPSPQPEGGVRGLPPSLNGAPAQKPN